MVCVVYQELQSMLGEALSKNKFYVPRWVDLQIASNMTIIPSDNLSVSHQGMILPSALSGFGGKYFNPQHRFNRYQLKVPVVMEEIPKVLFERHEFITRLSEYSVDHSPYFTPVAYGLPIFNRRGGR